MFTLPKNKWWANNIVVQLLQMHNMKSYDFTPKNYIYKYMCSYTTHKSSNNTMIQDLANELWIYTHACNFNNIFHVIAQSEGIWISISGWTNLLTHLHGFKSSKSIIGSLQLHMSLHKSFTYEYWIICKFTSISL